MYTPGGHKATRKEVEDAYWRCKVHSGGYGLAYAAQEAIAALPPTATLLIRTAYGHEMSFSPSDVSVAMTYVDPREATQIVFYDEGPGPHYEAPQVLIHRSEIGVRGIVPWPWLIIGERGYSLRELNALSCFILDLGIAQVGGHGTGGEHFVLEREYEFFRDVLLRCVEVCGPIEEAPRITEEHMTILMKSDDDEACTDEGASTDTVVSGEPDHLAFYRATLIQWAEEREPTKTSRPKSKSPASDFVKTFGENLKTTVLKRLEKVAAGANNFCKHCGRDGAEQRCSQCHAAHYCDKACQKAGWAYHKKWCQPRKH